MNATPVTKDQRNLVRVLSADHDLKTVSELTNVPYANVRQIVSRTARKSDSSQTVTNHVQAVAERLQDTLAARKHESRTLLSEYQVKALHEATAHEKPLSITRQVNDLASIHAKVWPEDQTKEANFSLNVLNLNMFSDTDGPTLD